MPKTWEERTALYCGYLIQEDELQSSTIKTYVSAIKSVLKDDGYSWDNELLVLSSLTKACKMENDSVKSRLPIKRKFLDLILNELKIKFSLQPYLQVLYITAFLLAYFGLMRVGELCKGDHSVKAIDVHLADDNSKVMLVLRSSKTHTTGMRPQTIKIRANSLEVDDQESQITKTAMRARQHKLFCPVKYAKKFVSIRPPLKSNKEQFLVFQDNSPLRDYHMRNTLRSVIDKLGLNSNLYDVHSFRIGKATDLMREKMDIEEIKRIGRWRSNAVYDYLRNF